MEIVFALMLLAPALADRSEPKDIETCEKQRGMTRRTCCVREVQGLLRARILKQSGLIPTGLPEIGHLDIAERSG